MKASEEMALKDFLLDINCLKKLENWTDDFNLFDMLKITNTEIRHSNILAWLLDPNENHGLGDAFIKEFVTKVISLNKEAFSEKYNAFDILLQNFHSYHVYRESNNMDIVLHSYDEKTVIVIENKIWSGESHNQLKTYRENSKKLYPDCTQYIYVFLTPDGKSPSDSNWLALSYGDVVEVLEILENELILRDEIKLVINNYISVVRKKIVQEKDEKLVQICNEIYSKHRTALKLIFENVKIDDSVESEIMRNELKKMSEKGEIILIDENRWAFLTKQMNDYLPPLSESNSSWNTTWVYYYWFEKTGEKLVIHFELGGNNVPEETKNREKAIIDALGKKQKEKGFRYYRLFYKDVKISQSDDYEDNFEKAIRSLVKSALEFEKDLFAKLVTHSEQ